MRYSLACAVCYSHHSSFRNLRVTGFHSCTYVKLIYMHNAEKMTESEKKWSYAKYARLLGSQGLLHKTLQGLVQWTSGEQVIRGGKYRAYPQ